MADDRTIRVRLLAEVQSYQQAMRSAGTATTDFGRQVSGMGKATQADMDRIGHSALLMAGGMAAGFGLAIKAAIDWESAFAGVAKTVNGTASEMSDLEDGLRSMALELPATHQEIAAVAEAAGALGIARPAIESFTRTMIDLGETTNLTADQAATSIAQIANIMGTASSDFDRLGSSLVYLGNNGASTEAQILELANRIAAAGNIAGLSEADILAIGSAMASVGIDAEAGGTAMSKVITTMSDAVLDGGEKLETFARVAGMSASEFAAAFREDGAEALNFFIEGLGRMIDSGQSLTPVFDDLSLSDARLMNALKSLAGQATIVGTSLDDSRSAWEENTALSAEAGKRYGTTAAQLEMLRNQVVDLGIDIGGSLVPALRTAASGLSIVVTGFREMPGPLQQVGTGLGVATTALLGFLAVAPRIAATKQALQGMGSGGQFLARNLGTMGKVLGVAGLALTAYSVVLGQNAQKQAEAEAAVQKLTDAMKEQGSVVGEVSRQSLGDVLLEGDVGESFRAAGGDLRVLTDAIEENGASLDGLDNRYRSLLSIKDLQQRALATGTEVGELTEDIDVLSYVLDEAGLSGTDLASELVRLAQSGELTAGEFATLLDRLGDQDIANQDAAQSFHNLTEAQQSAGDAAEETASQRNDAFVALQSEAGAVEALMDAYDEWEKQQRAITDPIFGVQQAVVGLADAQLAYTDSVQAVTDAQAAWDQAVREHGSTSEEATEAQRDYEDAVRDWQGAQRGAIDAAADYDVAIHKLGAAIQANPTLLQQSIDKLNEWVSQGAITQQQADVAAESFRLLAQRALAVPSDVAIDVDADTTEAERRLAALRTTLQRLANQGVIVQGRAGVAIYQAEGGIVPGSGRGDIVPAMLEPGEFVVRRHAAESIGYDALYQLNRFATGGVVGGAMAAVARHGAAVNLVSGTAAGQSVIVADDIDATRSALDSLADAYVRLRDAVGEASASEVLFAAQSAEDFDRLAAGAEDALGRLKVMYETGAISGADYLAGLREQLAGQEEFSDGWYSTWQEILRVERDALDDQERIEDARYELGLVSEEQRRATLERRLANEELYSDRYVQIQRELEAFDREAIARQVDRDRKRLGDLNARRADLASLYVEARREANETGGDFDAILARLQAEAAAEASLQAEANRYALAHTPRTAPNPADFTDTRAVGAWQRVGAASQTTVTNNYFPGATIRENVDMTAAWQQLAMKQAMGQL